MLLPKLTERSRALLRFNIYFSISLHMSYLSRNAEEFPLEVWMFMQIQACLPV